MPEQSKNDIPDDGLFLNLLTRVLEIIKSKPFANMDEDELSLYADYVQYRAQRDLFELFEDVSPGTTTWENFRLMMRGTQELRDICMAVICRKIGTALCDFNFTEKEIPFCRETDEPVENMLYAAQLFSESEGIILMALFLLFAELAHFIHLRDTVCPGYKWEDYYHDLFHGGKLWDAVRIAFRGAIQRLDFKPDWLEVGFNEL